MIKLIQYLPKSMQYAAGFTVGKLSGVFSLMTSQIVVTAMSSLMNILFVISGFILFVL